MRYAPLQAKCEKEVNVRKTWPVRGGGGGGSWGLHFAGRVPLPLKYSVANHRPHLGHVWYTVDNFFYIEPSHFQIPTYLRFAKMCDRILVILLKMQPQSTQP